MKKIILFLFSGFLCVSCSLKYDETVEVDSKVPEFVFENTVMTRYENNKVAVEMKAGVLEQYKNSSETFASKVSFYAYDDGEVTTTGSCDYMYTDTERDIYELYDNIVLDNISEKTKFYANVLKWNSKSEQLTSGRGEMVKVEKDGTVIRGTGFSASGISKAFSFRGTVSGDINTKDQKEENYDD